VSVFEAIADPTRRQIVALLAEGDQPAGEIASRFSVSRPAISRHLRVLREAGVASAREVGQQRVYRLDPKALDEVGAWLEQTRSFWNARLDVLEAHVAEPGPTSKPERSSRAGSSAAGRRRRRRR
jgi:DNA-binding transcriptional ArsR family regulator